MKRFVTMLALVCFALPATAEEQVSKEVDQQILGAWQLQFTAPDGARRTPTVIVGRQYKKYVAWYIGDQQPQPFQNVQLQGDKLVGTIVPAERPDITVTCESTLKAPDQCKGTARFQSTDGGATGSWDFQGQRMTMSSFDEVMKWTVSFLTPDNEQHDATVTVVSKDGTLYAWFSGKDHELPARSLSVQGDRVEMKVSAESPEGTQVDVTFRGTVAGDTVQGHADYQLQGQTGSFPFKGKRAS